MSDDGYTRASKLVLKKSVSRAPLPKAALVLAIPFSVVAIGGVCQKLR